MPIVLRQTKGTPLTVAEVDGNFTHLNDNANLTGDVSSIGNATTLANTDVTPGSYTNTTLTVDSKGRITSASTGTGGSAIGETFNPFLLMGA